MIGQATALLLFTLLLAQPVPCAQQGPTEAEKEAARVRVGMTKQQQTQLEAVFQDSDKQEREIRTHMRDLYKQLYNLYDAYEFDRKQAVGIQREILDLYRRRIAIH